MRMMGTAGGAGLATESRSAAAATAARHRAPRCSPPPGNVVPWPLPLMHPPTSCTCKQSRHRQSCVGLSPPGAHRRQRRKRAAPPAAMRDEAASLSGFWTVWLLANCMAHRFAAAGEPGDLDAQRDTLRASRALGGAKQPRRAASYESPVTSSSEASVAPNSALVTAWQFGCSCHAAAARSRAITFVERSCSVCARTRRLASPSPRPPPARLRLPPSNARGGGPQRRCAGFCARPAPLQRRRQRCSGDKPEAPGTPPCLPPGGPGRPGRAPGGPGGLHGGRDLHAEPQGEWYYHLGPPAAVVGGRGAGGRRRSPATPACTRVWPPRGRLQGTVPVCARAHGCRAPKDARLPDAAIQTRPSAGRA